MRRDDRYKDLRDVYCYFERTNQSRTKEQMREALKHEPPVVRARPQSPLHECEKGDTRTTLTINSVHLRLRYNTFCGSNFCRKSDQSWEKYNTQDRGQFIAGFFVFDGL